jgi:uncharacterized LabA/DUF88 family protein
MLRHRLADRQGGSHLSTVAAYVDGFNLYHGLRSKHGRKYLWLDLEVVVTRLLKPDQELAVVRYFTARVRDDAPALARQSSYLGALDAHAPRIDIRLGRFQEKNLRCHHCGTAWRTYEEKETDVSIAVSLVEDAATDLFDVALLVSADSDLCPAIRAVQRINPEKRVVAVFPPHRRSDELRRVANAAFTLGDANIRASLLPDSVDGPEGRIFARPRSWR